MHNIVGGGKEKQNHFAIDYEKIVQVIAWLYKQQVLPSYLNPKGEYSSCKIDGFMAGYASKLKWMWQA